MDECLALLTEAITYKYENFGTTQFTATNRLVLSTYLEK